MRSRQGQFAREWHALVAAFQRLFHVRKARDAWEQTWEERQAALEKLFGPSAESVLHAPVPFHLGGQADVLIFRRHIVGATLYVTADLTGDDSGQANNDRWDRYELAICVRGDDRWPPETISRLATYCLHNPLNPGETMDIESAVPQPSTIKAFLFSEYGSFPLQSRRCGVLLCVGITADELQHSFDAGTSALLEQLRGCGVYPFTDLARSSCGGGAA